LRHLQLLGDAEMMTALRDRLTHHCHILETGYDNCRFNASSATTETQNTTACGAPLRDLGPSTPM
jgi:hypothetical protein